MSMKKRQTAAVILVVATMIICGGLFVVGLIRHTLEGMRKGEVEATYRDYLRERYLPRLYRQTGKWPENLDVVPDDLRNVKPSEVWADPSVMSVLREAHYELHPVLE